MILLSREGTEFLQIVRIAIGKYWQTLGSRALTTDD